VALGSGVIEVFAPGTDNAAWHRRRTGGTWQPWESLGGVLTGAHVTAAAWGPGFLDIFARGTDGRMFTRWWTGTSWTGWAPTSGLTPTGSLPSAAGSADRDDAGYPNFGIDVLYQRAT
jgi:hypothetical protein